jgi:hypothetical protein
MTSIPPLPLNRFLSTSGLVVLLAICTWAGPVYAQGSRLESFFNDAGRFLERQGRALERELNEMTAPNNKPPVAIGRHPPLPKRNPARTENRTTISNQVTSGPTPYPAAPQAQPAGSPHPIAPIPQISADPTDLRTAVDHQDTQVPLPAPHPRREEKDEAPLHPRDIAAPAWTHEQIAAAKARCDVLLEDIDITFGQLPPLREGLCGSASPIRVVAIGREPLVKIDPPATLSCPMAAALVRWLNDTVQPIAENQLGSRVTALRNAASYACRNRYGSSDKPISEHARANALDIAAFELQTGAVVSVLEGWPIIAAPAVPNIENDQTMAANPAPEPPQSEASETAASPPPAPETNAPPAQTAAVPVAAMVDGDPPTRPAIAEPAPDPTPENTFLRALHGGACDTFGTVIGPDANEAHRDHLHFDMRKREHGGYCE